MHFESLEKYVRFVKGMLYYLLKILFLTYFWGRIRRSLVLVPGSSCTAFMYVRKVFMSILDFRVVGATWGDIRKWRGGGGGV